MALSVLDLWCFGASTYGTVECPRACGFARPSCAAGAGRAFSFFRLGLLAGHAGKTRSVGKLLMREHLSPPEAWSARCCQNWVRTAPPPSKQAIVIANTVNHFNYFIYLNWLPTYFHDVVGLNVRSSSLFTFLPWLAMVRHHKCHTRFAK